MPTVDEMRIIMDAETARMMAKLNEADRHLARFEKSTSDRLKRFDGYFRGAATAVGVLGSALGTRQIVEYANAWTQTERAIESSEDIFGMRLRSAGELVKLANAARIDVESYGKVYIRTAAAIRDFGYDESVAARMTSSLSMALKLGSASASEQASVLLQFSQALQKGKLDGDEFRSVMENAGVVQELLADRLKVSKGEIIAMAAAGKLQVKDLVGALIDGGDKIERIFKRTPATVDESFTVLRNSMIAYVGDLDDAVGGTEKLVGAVTGLANNLETVGNGALVVGSALLSAFAPRALVGVGALATGLAAAASPLAIIAAVVGGAAAAMSLFGDDIGVTADGVVTLKDTAEALIDVIGAELTPMWDAAGAAWAEAVAAVQQALSGLPISLDDIVAGARKAVNLTIGVFMFAAKAIPVAFYHVPNAIGEMMVDMANAVVRTINEMVARIAEVINEIPGIEIEVGKLDEIANPLAGFGARAREAAADAGRQFGRDFVGEASDAVSSGMTEISERIGAKAREIADLRRWAAGTKVDRAIELKRGKPPIDQTMVKEMRKAAEEVEGLYRRALEATGHYRQAVIEDYEHDLAKFREMLDKKLISQQQFDAARHNLALIAAKEMNEAIEKEFARVREATDAVAGAMTKSFDTFLDGGTTSFREFAHSVISDMARIAFRMAIIEPLFGSSGKGFGAVGDLFNFGGFRADGGPVMPGRAYVVGERRPELFVPSVPGTILPSAGAGGVTISMPVTINAQGAYPESVAEIRKAVAGLEQRVPAVAVRAVRDARDRGGL